MNFICTSWKSSLALLSEGCTTWPVTFMLPWTTRASSGLSVLIPTFPCNKQCSKMVMIMINCRGWQPFNTLWVHIHLNELCIVCEIQSALACYKHAILHHSESFMGKMCIRINSNYVPAHLGQHSTEYIKCLFLGSTQKVGFKSLKGHFLFLIKKTSYNQMCDFQKLQISHIYGPSCLRPITWVGVKPICK